MVERYSITNPPPGWKVIRTYKYKHQILNIWRKGNVTCRSWKDLCKREGLTFPSGERRKAKETIESQESDSETEEVPRVSKVNVSQNDLGALFSSATNFDVVLLDNALHTRIPLELHETLIKELGISFTEKEIEEAKDEVEDAFREFCKAKKRLKRAQEKYRCKIQKS